MEALKSGTYVYEESLKPIAPRSREIPPIIVQTIPYFSVNNFYSQEKHGLSTLDPYSYFDTSLNNKPKASWIQVFFLSKVLGTYLLKVRQIRKRIMLLNSPKAFFSNDWFLDSVNT